ncbi:hypothetical protein JTB14_021813 [Gonioctena quinquepunctata]|nr:hypothetical protein JTB14_021813 [Gonioctena quinquepunctata]
MKDMEIAQVNMKTAFLNGDLTGEIYLEIPKRLEVTESNMRGNVKKIIHKFNIIDCAPISTPADPNVLLANSAQDETQIQFPYREAVSFLMCAAII